MEIVFYVSAGIAVFATAMAVTRLSAVYALLYLILSLLAVAVAFFTLGAPFVAALEVIVYAGAIVVLFLFVVMMLNLGPTRTREMLLWAPGTWVGPAILSAILLGELVYLFTAGGGTELSGTPVGPKEVSVAMYGPYLVAVELASMLLLAGLVGAYHLGRKDPREEGSR